MPLDKLEDIIHILKSGAFTKLIGAVETRIIECKGAPYPLKHETEKQELAKDVAGFANAEGGLILLGVATEINPMHREEEITKIRPFQEALVNIKQYYDVLQSWIYPALHQIDIQWYPSSDDVKKGIIAIQIPKQPETKRPFLVTRTVEITGKMNNIVFGYFERRRSSVDPITVTELHSILRDGLHYETLNNQYENIQESLSQILSRPAEESKPDLLQLRSERVAEALAATGLASKPSFILTAIPDDSIEIQGLFSRNSEIVKLLEKPPTLRYGGFDLNTGSPARIVRGVLRRATSEGNNSLELWRDGTVIFTAVGDANYLSWGKYTPQMDFLKINQLTLAESTYLFAELCRLIFYQHSSPPPSKIEFTLELKYMTINNEPCGLYSGPLQRYSSGSLHRAPNSDFIVRVTFTGDDLRPGQLAFELIKELYRWFGFEDDVIPYTKQIDGHLEIDPAQISHS
jgi:hypothetical protein